MNLYEKETLCDFSGEYHIGADRYFRCYKKSEVYEIIMKTGFRTLVFREEIGREGQKWLVYVLKKGA